MGPRPAAWEWGKPEAERLSASLPPFFPSEVPQNFIVYDQEGRKNLYTMISPDILMEILHYSQVYNIGIEITWTVGRGSRYRIQKASSNKKEEGGKNKKTKKPKPQNQTSAIVQAGSRAGMSDGGWAAGRQRQRSQGIGASPPCAQRHAGTDSWDKTPTKQQRQLLPSWSKKSKSPKIFTSRSP